MGRACHRLPDGAPDHGRFRARSVSRLYLTTEKVELARRRALVPKGRVVEAWADHHDGGALWIGEEAKTLLDETGGPPPVSPPLAPHPGPASFWAQPCDL